MFRALRLPSSVLSNSVRAYCTGQSTSAESGLRLTAACAQQLNAIRKSDDEFLRITVDGGGCSGFEYKFALDNELTADDQSFSRDGASVVVDKMSLTFIDGSTIDYQQELIKSSFRVVDNPLADTKCSCGVSFSLKM